ERCPALARPHGTPARVRVHRRRPASFDYGNRRTARRPYPSSCGDTHHNMEEIGMKRLLAGLVLIAPLAAFGADASPDSAFYKHAAEGGIAEVELGSLAQQKSSNQSVKDFGAMMVKDHSAANDKLKAVAASKNISLPTS